MRVSRLKTQLPLILVPRHKKNLPNVPSKEKNIGTTLVRSRSRTPPKQKRPLQDCPSPPRLPGPQASQRELQQASSTSSTASDLTTLSELQQFGTLYPELILKPPETTEMPSDTAPRKILELLVPGGMVPSPKRSPQKPLQSEMPPNLLMKRRLDQALCGFSKFRELWRPSRE